MILKQIRVDTASDIITNSYIVYDNGESIVVDPGGEPKKIIEALQELNTKPKYIVLTHCHADHIGAVEQIKKQLGGEIVISYEDSKGLQNPMLNLAPYMGATMPSIKSDIEVKEEDLIRVGNLDFKVIETPGHTKGGICMYCEKEKIVFSGDTLFEGAYGRIDLPSGSYTDIINSISQKLMKLPKETMVYPGHGRPTTIENEEELYESFK